MSEPTVEEKALKMGWIPKEDFKGDEKRWVDAETYVARADEFIPFIKAENRGLKTQVDTLKGDIVSLKDLLKGATESITALKTYNSEMNKEKVERIRTQLLAEIVAAREEGDVSKEEALRDKLADAKASLKTSTETTKVETTKPNGVDAAVQAAFNEWVVDNSWWNDNRRMRALAVDIAAELNEKGELPNDPKARFLKVGEATKKEFAALQEPQARQSTKVEGSRGGGDGGGSGKTFADLPPEAKAGCDSFGKDLVGKGKTYATQAEWRKKYVEDYFAS